jgi:hypothetical protein
MAGDQSALSANLRGTCFCDTQEFPPSADFESVFTLYKTATIDQAHVSYLFLGL